MILALDIGNTTVTVGMFDSDSAAVRPMWQMTLSADIRRTRDEYFMLLQSCFSVRGISADSVTGAVIASVVPALTYVLFDAVAALCCVKPILIGPGTRTGLNIRIEQQTQLGADIVANAVAALAMMPAPIVVADLGTATTLAVIDRQYTLIGAIICPGVRMSLDALSDSASQLSMSDLARPRAFIGKNTYDSVTSGVIYGHARMLDGLVFDLKKHLHADENAPLSLLSTGGNAPHILPHCRAKFTYLPDLTLRGLALLFQKNL